MEPTVGIIGVGHLATYLVAGLRHAGDERRIVLSPRNAERSAALRDSHGCEIASDNQSVADASEIIVLAVRPAHCIEALSHLRLHRGQLVVSVAAGVPRDTLAPLVEPAGLVRALPVSSAEVGKGAVPLYPDEPHARHLLGKVGTVVALSEERFFEHASVASCLHGCFFDLFARLGDWAVAQGVEPHQARLLMLEAVHGASALAV